MTSPLTCRGLIQLGTIRQRHVAGERERDRADRAEAAVEQLRARVDLATQERDQARQDMARFTGEWERLRADLERVAVGTHAAQGRADTLRQEMEAVKAASLPRRIWRAIRGRQ